MRALVKSGSTVHDTGVGDVRQPVAGAGQVILQIEACGLCGSDVHAWRGDVGYEWVTTPVVMGHELVGRVVSRGPGVEWPQIDERVVPISILGCGRCATCETEEGPICPSRTVIGLSHDGGAAEYAVVPADDVIPVPADMSSKRAVLAEPLAVAVHAIRRLPQLSAGDRVGVCGPGPVGLLAAWALTQRGIDAFVVGAERDRELRLSAARQLGLDAFVTGDREVPATKYWIEASGAEAGLASVIAHIMPAGIISVVAMYGRLPAVDVNRLVRAQLQITGSYASLPADYEEAIALLADGQQIEDVLVREFALEDAVKALEATAAGTVAKAVLVP